MKYIDAEKLKEMMLPSYEEAKMESHITTDAVKWGKVEYIFDFIFHLIDSLQQEQPSLPSDLDEVAENYYEQDCPYDGEARVVNREHDVWFPSQAIEDAFKAGAEWMKEHEQPEEVDEDFFFDEVLKVYDDNDKYPPRSEEELTMLEIIARHFYELGFNARKEE